YYLPYKVRITNNLEQINEKIKQIFIKNNWLNNLDKKFYDFLINLNFLNRIFDANLLKKINNIEKVLMFKRDLIWKEILNIDSQNNLKSIKLKTNLNKNFWINFDKYSKEIVSYLNFDVNDLRCYLLTKINI
ncbi:hypothetical protein PR068_03290, partial [Metamycoplasma hyosynoviae]